MSYKSRVGTRRSFLPIRCKSEHCAPLNKKVIVIKDHGNSHIKARLLLPGDSRSWESQRILYNMSVFKCEQAKYQHFYQVLSSIKRSVPNKVTEAKKSPGKPFMSIKCLQLVRSPQLKTLHLLAKMTFGDSQESNGSAPCWHNFPLTNPP